MGHNPARAQRGASSCECKDLWNVTYRPWCNLIPAGVNDRKQGSRSKYGTNVQREKGDKAEMNKIEFQLMYRSALTHN